MVENCPFCNLNQDKTRILEETKNTRVILSNPALVKGHCLIVPKRHVMALSELSKGELDELLTQVVKWQERLLKKFWGVDIRQNLRPKQKEDTYKISHLHIHLQPREFEDELYQKSQIHEKGVFRHLSSEELNEVKELLK